MAGSTKAAAVTCPATLVQKRSLGGLVTGFIWSAGKVMPSLASRDSHLWSPVSPCRPRGYPEATTLGDVPGRMERARAGDVPAGSQRQFRRRREDADGRSRAPSRGGVTQVPAPPAEAPASCSRDTPGPAGPNPQNPRT